MIKSDPILTPLAKFPFEIAYTKLPLSTNGYMVGLGWLGLVVLGF